MGFSIEKNLLCSMQKDATLAQNSAMTLPLWTLRLSNGVKCLGDNPSGRSSDRKGPGHGASHLRCHSGIGRSLALVNVPHGGPMCT